jgi:hypothetical protein
LDPFKRVVELSLPFRRGTARFISEKSAISRSK